MSVNKKAEELAEMLRGLPEHEINEILEKIKKQTGDSAHKTVEGSREEKISKILEKVKNSKSSFELLRYMNGNSRGIGFDLYKTFLSIGIKENGVRKSGELEDYEPEEKNSINNHQRNYKMWLGRKLFLSEKDIDEKTVEDIDNYSIPYVTAAINHIDKYLGNFNEDTRKMLRSQYYEQIHHGEGKRSIFEILKYWYVLKKREAQIKYERKNNPRTGINYENVLEELKMGLFEIQRILSLAVLYIDREKNQNFQHTSEDTDFVIRKLEKIVTNELLQGGNLGDENPLYHMTDTGDFEWGKDEEGNYVLKLIKKGEGNPKKTIVLDSITIRGRERPYSQDTTEINLVHIGSRMKKKADSAVDKFVRKGLSTFNEILDHKGFIMVVNNFDEGRKLLRILENELGTVETSWTEEPVYMSSGGNQNTNDSYNSIKAIIKVPYKGKLIRSFFEAIEEVLKSNSRLKKELDKIKRLGININEETYRTLEPLIEKEARGNNELRKIFNRLKGKFGRKEYNVEVEIQIFDVQNYFKAEIDKESPAHHDHYKRRQVLDGLGYYFPFEVYGERRLMNAISDVVKEES